MEILIYVAALCIIYYVLQIGLLIYGFCKIKPFVKLESDNSTKFSIVIPFRNEQKKLPNLLQTIAQLDYDNTCFEIIFVNDASTDDSLKIINSWRFKNPYVQLTILDNVLISKSPKKDAITRAITVAKFPWILTIDADCLLPSQLLQTYASFIFQNSDKEFIVGGVALQNTFSLAGMYQVLDMAALQAVTIGSFGIDEAFMCNGANLLYTKNIFNKVNGYAGVNHIASGDDVFLLQKVQEYKPEKIKYALHKDLVVKTAPVANFFEVIMQRVRWSKKAVAYQTVYPKILGISTVLANLSLLLLAVLLWIDTTNTLYISLLFVVKLLIDFILLLCYNNRVNVRLRYFIFSSFMYPVLLFVTIFFGMLFSNKWKDRKIKA